MMRMVMDGVDACSIYRRETDLSPGDKIHTPTILKRLNCWYRFGTQGDRCKDTRYLQLEERKSTPPQKANLKHQIQ